MNITIHDWKILIYFDTYSASTKSPTYQEDMSDGEGGKWGGGACGYMTSGPQGAHTSEHTKHMAPLTRASTVHSAHHHQRGRMARA